MNINIKVTSVSKPEWKVKGKSKWQEVEVAFDSDKGAQTRKLRSFNKEVYEQAVNMKPGKYYDVVIEKEGDFWNWMSISESASQEAPKSGGVQSAGDRVSDRDRQTSIVRQSSLAQAVAYHQGQGSSPDEVIATAQIFENFVHTGEYVVPEVDEDDQALQQVEDAGEDAPPARRTRRTAEVD